MRGKNRGSWWVQLVWTAVVLSSLTQLVKGDVTIPIQGIGTSLPVPLSIQTRVDSVTYSGPVDLVVDGLPVCEIRGTISGIGWGGTPLVPRPNLAHYQYRIPFVARWRRGGTCPRLVFYHHGGGTSLMVAVKREKQAPATNPNRFAELAGNQLVGIPALLDGAVYISVNRRGLQNDGTFSAFYSASDVSPLTAAEVTALETDLAGSPGDPNFHQPGIAAGEPVPLAPTNDAPTFRDVSRALEQVLTGLVGQRIQTRIAVGTSSGARLLASLNFGRSVFGPQSLRTGGNHIVPYDEGSPRIFDAFLLNGFPYAAGVAQADPTQPLSAYVIFLQGQGDERYQQHLTMVDELLNKGVTLPDKVRVYEVKNLVHVPRDVINEVSPPSPGDRIGCLMGAAIRNLRCWVEHRQPPPTSRIAGRIVNGALRIDQAGGATTDLAPVPQDPAIDSYVVDPMLTPRPIGPGETSRWQAVTTALPHIQDAIALPGVACRVGGYRLRFFGSELNPLSSPALRQKYGSFEQYRDCVRRTVSALEAEGLYDARVESADATAELARSLFE